jgi:hypothetical protein
MTTKKAKRAAPKKKAARGVAKASVKKRTLNVTAKTKAGSPFNEQDVKRRLGNFESAGEHPRVGGRTTGIVGQSKQHFRTDNKRTKR